MSHISVAVFAVEPNGLGNMRSGEEEKMQAKVVVCRVYV